METNPSLRQPKGDHNRRLSLGLEPEEFAVEAGVSVDELRQYELTSPDHEFDVSVAARVGEALERLERVLPNSQTGRNNPAQTPEAAQGAPHMDHSNHVRLSSTELTSTNLDNAKIYDAQDNEIGHVSHIHGNGASTLVVIDVGGFLGLGSKRVGVPVSNLDFMRDEDGKVHAVTTWTKDELKDMPEHHDSH